MNGTGRTLRMEWRVGSCWPIVGFVGVLLVSGFAQAREANAGAGGNGVAESEELLIELSVPLLSPLFASTPVAEVDGEPITLGDLTRSISMAHAERVEQETSTHKNYEVMLQRLITRQLVIQEARNIGFDEVEDVRNLVEDFRTRRLVGELVEEQLKDLEPDPAEVEALYARLARELRMIALEFKVGEDAEAFRADCESGDAFLEEARRWIEQGKAKGDLDIQQYAKLKDLRPEVAQAAYEMEVGEISAVFPMEGEKYLVFYIADSRVYDDPEARAEARKQLLDPMRRKAADAYIAALIAKHATVDDELLRALDFERRQTGFLWMRKEEPVDFEVLRADQRVLATVHEDEPFEITVGDLTRAIEKRQHHGIELAAESRALNHRKWPVLQDILLRRSGKLEAALQGRDQREEFVEAVREYENSLLWGMFQKKVVEPEIRIMEAELRAYYEEHLAEFSTPKMLRMSSLAFHERADAESALAKYRRGSDLKWLSANSPGQVDKSSGGGTPLFDAAVMSWDALPSDLRQATDGVRPGDALLYVAQDDLAHVVVVDQVFPPKPQPYGETREAIAEILYAQKGQAALDEWSAKLRDAYDVRVFVAAPVTERSSGSGRRRMDAGRETH